MRRTYPLCSALPWLREAGAGAGCDWEGRETMNLRRGVPTRTLAAVGVLAAVGCSTLGVQHASAATGTMVATVRSFANPTKVGDPGNPERDNLYVYNSA